MKKDIFQWTVLCCFNVMLLSCANATHTKKQVVVYGLKQGSQLHVPGRANADYVLQIDSFSKRSLAVLKRNQIAHQVNSPVKVVFSEQRKTYNVIIGPFADAQKLVDISRSLLAQQTASDAPKLAQSHSVLHTPAAVKPADLAATVVEQKTVAETQPAVETTKVAQAADKMSESSTKTLTDAQAVNKAVVLADAAPVRSVTHAEEATVASEATPVNARRHHAVKVSNDHQAARYHANQNVTVAKPVKKTAVWKDMNMATAPAYKTGIYIGASVGPQWNISGTPAAYSGLEGTLSIGLGHLWNRLYLAGEFFGGSSINLKNYLSTSGYSIRSTSSYGGDFIPGFMITDTFLGYLRIGGLQTRFNDLMVNSNAWQIGVGGQTNVYGNLDLRAEYIFSLYDRVPNLGRPQVSQFNVGLTYKFV